MQKAKRLIQTIPGLVWGGLAVVLCFAIFAPGFLTYRNIIYILVNSSILLLVSCGMTMAIVSQQIDMSVGGVMSISGMVVGLYISRYPDAGAPQIAVAILLGMLVGGAFGLFNGLMIGRFKYNFWLITFATMSIGYGAAQVVTSGALVSGFGNSFQMITNAAVLGIPSVILISAVLVALMCAVTYRTKFGMHIYAVGDSELCAAQSGIDVASVRLKIYLISGLLAGLGGVLLIARTNSASPIVGNGYEFNAIAAVIIGGASFEGGKGGISGTIVGTVIMSAIADGLVLMGASNYWQQTLTGLFILVIIVLDVIRDQRKKESMLRRVYQHA